MKKRIVSILLAVTLGATIITGCGAKTDLDTGKNVENQSDNNPSDKANDGTDGPSGAADKVGDGAADMGDSESGSVMDMLYEADVMATVVDFSESGCSVIKGTDSEDEQKIAAAGADANDENKINVVYSDNVRFQLATAAIGENDANLQDTDKSELKKQSNVYLYGVYQDDGTFVADKVIVYRTLR